jgi:hypothetical protein
MMELLILAQQSASEEVEQAIRWLRLPPAWLIGLVIVPLLVAAVGFFYRRENPSGGPAWKWLLGGLRVGAILIVLAMLAQPAWRKTTYETLDSSIVVLVDDSLSMDIADRFTQREIPEKLGALLRTSTEMVEETTRYDLVRRIIGDPQIRFLERLRDKGKLVVGTFAAGVQEVAKLERNRSGSESRGLQAAALEERAPADLLPAYDRVRNDARVQETRLGEALRDAVSSVLGAGFGQNEERVSGVILFSDGQQNSGSVSAVDVARRLGERGTPVFTIGVGNPDDPRDVRLINLDVNEVVLVEDSVPFDATVIADGFEGERVRIDLKIDEAIVDTRYTVLEGQGRRQLVRLEHRPQKPGEFTATVEVEKLGGEIFYGNNSISKQIRVLDQKIKVLYVENLPRWEYRYLKNALTRDPSMEAQVYLFSADPGFVQESSPAVPPLRTLPRERAELFAYHVIVLGDVGPKDLGEEMVKLLKEFVLEGGGLVMIAGPHANPSQYLHSELYAVLPVEVPEQDRFGQGGSKGPVTSAFNVQLTPVGREHTVMRLDNDREQNIRLWEDDDDQFYEHLPGFFWFAEMEREKVGATVLARHPRRIHPIHRKGLVIFAYMNYGNGKTFFSAVDNTWRWRAGVDNLYFYRFWGQVVRFVATGRLLGSTPRYSISTDKAIYNIGETVKIDARIFDATMKPSTEKSWTAYHQAQGREGEPPEKIELALNPIKEQGTYEGTISAGLRGRHDLWLGTESERLAFRSFNVEVPALEARDPKLNRTLLEAVASVSGGQYFDLHEASGAAEKAQGVSRPKEGLVENDDLWDEWWVVLLFTCVIALEWILRKSVRLL